MRKRVAIAVLIFVATAVATAIPAAIVLALLDIYLSGHSIVELASVPVFPGLDVSNFLFIATVILSGFIWGLLYWRFSKPR